MLHIHSSKQQMLVIGAGTATTIDALDESGDFVGGLILPGLGLMRSALARGTKGLSVPGGGYHAFGRNTADAMQSGCLHAQLGAIDRARPQLSGARPALCVLTGGYAETLAEHLAPPRVVRPRLALDGLLCIAQNEH